MNKKIIISIVVLAVAVVVWWLKAGSPAKPASDTAVPGAAENVYSQELTGLDEANISGELQTIDADLQKL